MRKLERLARNGSTTSPPSGAAVTPKRASGVSERNAQADEAFCANAIDGTSAESHGGSGEGLFTSFGYDDAVGREGFEPP